MPEVVSLASGEERQQLRDSPSRLNSVAPMESSVRRNVFFILYTVKRGNPIFYFFFIFFYSPVRITVTQYTTTLHLSSPVNNTLGKAEKKMKHNMLLSKTYQSK